MDDPVIMCSEDSRVLRLFSTSRFLERVLTNHNDIIVNLLKLDGQAIVLTGGIEGAIKHIELRKKCEVGKLPILNQFMLPFKCN